MDIPSTASTTGSVGSSQPWPSPQMTPSGSSTKTSASAPCATENETLPLASGPQTSLTSAAAPASDAGYFASASLDASGNPVVVHYDKDRQNLRIVRRIADQFEGEVLAEGEDYDPGDGSGLIEGNVGEFSTIQVSGGIEYVAYYDRTYGDLKLSWGTPGAHTIETVDDVGDIGQWPDLLIDSGTIHISYHDTTNQDLRYASGEPGSWSSIAVDQGDYVGADSAIFLENGSISIAYFDGRNNDMKLAWQNGGEWTIDTVTGTDSAQGFHNEVVTSSQGTFAACYDYTHRTLWFSAL